MFLLHKEKKIMTAEEYRTDARRHLQTYKEQWRIFLVTGIITIAVLAVIVAFAMAWFVFNDKVKSSIDNVSAEEYGFELKTYGSNGFLDQDILSSMFSNITLAGTDVPSFTTSGEHASINWMVSDESNMGNYHDGEIYSTAKDRKDYAIEPGSSGKLKFYIIPKQDGTQKFELDLNVIPYYATINASNEITSVSEVGKTGDTGTNLYARQFIDGHILFFFADGEQSLETTEWIKDGKISISIKNAIAGEEYPYTIYWIWPQVFSEIILNDSDRFLNGRQPILTTTLRDEIVKDMEQTPEKYFYNSLPRKPLSNSDEYIVGKIVDGITTGGIAEIHEKSPISEVGGYDPQNYVDLSSFYNQADQIIGSKISFIVVELNASMDGAAK